MAGRTQRMAVACSAFARSAWQLQSAHGRAAETTTGACNPQPPSHAPKPPPPQIHLVVDTGLTGDHVDVKAYASRGLSLGDKALATEFVELPCEVLMGEVERVGRESSVWGGCVVWCGVVWWAALVWLVVSSCVVAASFHQTFLNRQPSLTATATVPLLPPTHPHPPSHAHLCTAVNLLVSGDHERGKPLADAEGLPASIARLQQLLATAQRYVEDVVVSASLGRGGVVQEGGGGAAVATAVVVVLAAVRLSVRSCC